jgi:aryl-alcohol dehydrogenase-like predicted oxidoreductase
MKYRSLGDTDLQVSVICLGSMTWGEQNSEREGHEQLDYALEQGVNFVDTAELYAIPPKAATYGRTEEIIGSWLKRSHKRDRIVLASKIAGPGEWIPHIRGGNSRFDRSNLRQALEGSLRRLGTDCIDLYQLHWPERGTNFFGQLGYTHRAGDFTPMEETLGVLAEMVQAGKIRHVGLSNETPWGAMRFMETAERLGLPRPVSIQNPYNLLNRSFEVGLAEVAQRERMGLLAYSPLGFGVLSGKYLEQGRSRKGRLDLFPAYDRYSNPQARAAIAEYAALARRYGLQPAQMALAYVNSRAFLTSTIIGATSMEQLRQNIASADVTLDDTLLEEIEAIHRRFTYPSP